MAREFRSDGDLRAISEHLMYEVWMLRETAIRLASGAELGEVDRNALLESFTIHLRVLIDFLWPENPRPDDVVATDFFHEPAAWARVAPAFPPELLPARRRAGKEVAHLTYERLAVVPTARDWHFVPMADAVLQAFGKFAEAVGPAKFPGHSQ